MSKRPLARQTPGAIALVCGARVERRLVRERHRRAVCRQVRSGVSVGAAAARRRPHERLGPRVSADQRHRAQGRVARRRRRGLADRLRRSVPYYELVEDYVGIRACPKGSPGCPMATSSRDAAHLRRDRAAHALEGEVRPDADAGPDGEPVAARQQTAGVPLLRARASTGASRTGTSMRRSRRWRMRSRPGGARWSPARWSTRCWSIPIRGGRAACSTSIAHQSAARDLRPGRRALRADAGVGAHSLQLRDATGSERPRELERSRSAKGLMTHFSDAGAIGELPEFMGGRLAGGPNGPAGRWSCGSETCRAAGSEGVPARIRIRRLHRQRRRPRCAGVWRGVQAGGNGPAARARHDARLWRVPALRGQLRATSIRTRSTPSASRWRAFI